jgi:Fe-S-cluster containining protein
LLRQKRGLPLRQKHQSFSYPKNLRFKCSKCAICCGDTDKRIRRILLLKPEAERISAVTQKPIDEFADEIREEPYSYIMRKNSEGKCLFLNGNICLIYELRPLICRFYPFQLNGNLFTFTDECPAMGSGSLLGKNYFRKLMEKAEQSMRENQSSEIVK